MTVKHDAIILNVIAKTSQPFTLSDIRELTGIERSKILPVITHLTRIKVLYQLKSKDSTRRWSKDSPVV